MRTVYTLPRLLTLLVAVVLSVVFFVARTDADSELPTLVDSKASEALMVPDKVRILIVPGHEPRSGGAEYRSLKEREMNVELAEYLQALFVADPRYEVFVSRDDEAWSAFLKEYFAEKWQEIIAFQAAKKKVMKAALASGEVSKIDNPPHSRVADDIATRLYGINKWSNDNRIDLAIHIHFNEYPRKDNTKPGAYSGFAVYVPESQFSNANLSRKIAERVLERLSAVGQPSNFHREAAGIVEDQQLIALGANNSLDAASLLIEYGYIYEPKFAGDAQRHSVFAKYAAGTYEGVKDFFEGGSVVQ